MASCPRCGAPLEHDQSMCRVCGLPVGRSAAAAAVAARLTADRSRRRRQVVLTIVLVAVIAAAAVWFFVLRGPTSNGDEFHGTWRSQSMQSIGSATITRAGDAFDVLLVSGQTGQQARVQAHLDGDRLVMTPGDFSASGDPEAKQLELLLKLEAGDFRIELSSADPAHLVLRLTGTSPTGQSVSERAVLERVGPSLGTSP
ncbi:MAG TPA: zinc ribbon domain-containing protein [Thermoleophilia bacterium]|nr:zinc ribbon domain-containing protein [Thermoleophilia bacterium]